MKEIDSKTLSGNGIMDLTQIEDSGAARVIAIQGGHQVVGKLEAMGIVPDTIIVKKSASLWKGPIVIQKDSTQFAIGHAMAQRIIVEPLASGNGTV